MSHIYRVKARIEKVVPHIMRRAVAILQKMLGLEYALERKVVDYYGKEQLLDQNYMVFKWRGSNKARNFAIDLRTGEIVGDFYGQQVMLDTIRTKLEQAYAGAVAVEAVTRTWGGKMSEIVERGDDVFILVDV